MIPVFDGPLGEKVIYVPMRGSENTEGWLVLHSLSIANHIRQIEGEADFVVIILGTCILAIEVKSHQSIDQTWKLDSDAPTTRGPLQQASEAMHSRRSYLKKNVDLRSIPVLSAVSFTRVRTRTMLPTNPEWHDWQVMDSEDMRSAPAQSCACSLRAPPVTPDSGKS